MQEIPLLHFNERKAPVSLLILHCSAHNGEDMISCLNKSEVSAHYIIDLNGELIKTVDESKRAWHAGLGSWREFTDDLNSHSIGIEISNLSLGQEAYNEQQIQKLIPFCKKLMRKYNIKPQNVIGHSDSAPTRKADPGIAFPWKRLAKEGIGLWYQLRNATKIQENNVAKLLQIIGYKAETIEETIAAAYAFRRHFLPEEVCIEADVGQLVENVYPQKNLKLLEGEKFLKTLKAVAYSFKNA